MLTVSSNPNGDDGAVVTVGLIEQGSPRLVPALRDAHGHCRRDDRRRRRIPVDAIAVELPGRLTEDALEQARRRAGSGQAQTLAMRLRDTFGDDVFTTREAVEHVSQDPLEQLATWLTLWEHPEWFARAGRTAFRVRSDEERAAEQARIAERQAEEKKLHAAEQALRRLRSGETTLEALLATEADIRVAAESLLDPDHPCALSERVRRRISQLLEQQIQSEAPAWPVGHRLATALGHRDPWLVGNPVLNRHRHWLERQAHVEPSPFQGDTLQPQTDLVAIDDAGTTERDDAIGIAVQGNRTVVEVAVAWLAESIPDAWDEALAAVGTTVYLPTCTVPMLPPHVGSECHSLSDREARPALLLRWVVAEDGSSELTAAEVGRVRLAETCTYDEAAVRFGDRWPLAEQTAGALRRQRSRQGAGDIEIADTMVELRDGHPVALRRVEPWTGARHVVRELMILTNMTVAARLAARQLPAPFRGLERMGNSFVTRVDLRPMRHIGIGATSYTYVTSPIRRFVDILAQRQFGALLGRVPPMDRDRLRRLIRATEKGFQASGRWMAEAGRYWMLRYLETHPDTRLTGILDRKAEDGGRWRIRVEPVGLSATIELDRPPTGQTIPLRLVDVDAERGVFVVEPQ